jgi:homoserine kinase
MTAPARVTAFAPASIGNLAVGFDALGMAVEVPGDRVTVERTESPGVTMRVTTGCVTDLPARAEENTAGAALLALLEEVQPGFGLAVQLHKGIPLGSGLGGSAASAVGAVVAANALLSEPAGVERLLHWASAGEAVASGARHLDNVAPCLLGGIVLVGRGWTQRIPAPAGLVAVVAHPALRLDTARSRAVLPGEVPMAAFVDQSGRLGRFVAGCFSGDVGAIGAAMRDVVVEPARAPLVPGFRDVQAVALTAGAIACSISGGGPSVFAWCRGEAGDAVGAAMVAAFGRAGLQARAMVSRLDAPGARVVSA